MIVTTKDELEKARKRGDSEIIIEGKLAEKVRNGKKITTIGKITFGILAAAIATMPVTGGLSAAAVAPIAAMTGLEITMILAVTFVGVGLLMAIWKEYEEVEFSYNPLRLKLKKK